VSERTRVQLPAGVGSHFQVFLNGVPQQEGRDFRREGNELVFERQRETKKTVRYQELEGDEPPVVGTLYVQKFACTRLGDPERLTVTIAAVIQTIPGLALLALMVPVLATTGVLSPFGFSR